MQCDHVAENCITINKNFRSSNSKLLDRAGSLLHATSSVGRKNNSRSNLNQDNEDAAAAALEAQALVAREVDRKVEQIFSQADANNDGSISQAEFLWAMTGLDFHLLQRLPSGGGYSAEESYLYSSQSPVDGGGAAGTGVGAGGMMGDQDSVGEWDHLGAEDEYEFNSGGIHDLNGDGTIITTCTLTYTHLHIIYEMIC